MSLLIIDKLYVCFQEKRELIDCLVNGIRTTYSENIRQFCMRQQYYSTAAYKSLRKFFNGNLPTVRSLQMWYMSIDASPGITQSALDVLEQKAQSYQAEHNHPLHLAMMCDEMGIKKELCYCSETERFIGFDTLTNSPSPQNRNSREDLSQLNLANNALVYLVVGPDFKIPIAYELVSGLAGEQRAALTLQIIKSVEETGAKVFSLTSDGLAANITCAEELGVKFHEGKSYFMSPSYPDQKIYIIFDPPHMLKLVRKHFSSNMIYYQDQLVNWEILNNLIHKQSLENFNLCNKLSQKHIDWHLKPMNVRLAVETISDSVADALEQLRKDGYEEFKDSETTVEFLRFFNNAFDILNFNDLKKPNEKYKQKLCAGTATKIFEFAEKFKRYISLLEYRQKTQSKSILLSTADRGFFGFYNNFISFQGIYEDLIINGPFTEFHTFQFSQDHLETFFSLIRQALAQFCAITSQYYSHWQKTPT